MMSKGFIVDAAFAANDDDTDVQTTDIHIEDLCVTSPAEADEIIRVFIQVPGNMMWFSLAQAKALVEALNEVIDRYTAEPETQE